MLAKTIRLLALIALTGAIPHAAEAQIKKKGEEERFMKYTLPAAPPSLRVKDVVRTRVFHDEQGYFEKGITGAYERRDVIATVEDRQSIEGRVTSQFQADKEPVRVPPQVFSVKLIPHQSTLFGKFVAKFDPYGKDSGITIEQEGMYEMSVIEGSYEAFQKGGAITVEIKKEDHERYLAAVTKSFQHPGFLTFCAEEYREMQVRQIERQIAEAPDSVLPPGTDAQGRARFLEEVRTWRVQAMPTMRSTPARFHFSGDVMRSEVAESGLEIRFVTSIPNGNPIAAPGDDWMERYRVHKQTDFHAEDYDDTRVLDPREKLPGWYKPKWEQQEPVR